MGHSSITITLDTYTHLYRDEDDHVIIAQVAAPPSTMNVTPLHGRQVG